MATGGSKKRSAKPAARKRAPAKRRGSQAAKTTMPDSVRRAVERTVQSTVGSAGLTRDRAQEIVDEVVRRAEQSAARAGRGVRESVEAGQRRAEAAAGVGDRLREAIPRVATRDDVRKLQRAVERLEKRLDDLEAKVGKPRPARRSTRSRSATRTARPKTKGTSR